MNKPLALEMEDFAICTPLGDHEEECALPLTLRERSDFVLSVELVYWGNL